jgi:hypothetical protein
MLLYPWLCRLNCQELQVVQSLLQEATLALEGKKILCCCSVLTFHQNTTSQCTVV